MALAALVAVGAFVAGGVVLAAQQERLDDLESQLAATEKNLDDVEDELVDVDRSLDSILATIGTLSKGRDVGTLESRVDDLETVMFGSSVPTYEWDLISDVWSRINGLEQDVVNVKSCVSSIGRALSSQYSSYYYC